MKKTMKFKLLKLRKNLIEKDLGVYEMLQEMPQVDVFEQTNEFFGLTKEEAINKIEKLSQFAKGIGNDEDNPKCEHFVLFADNAPVAIGALMLEMTDFWRKHRGHVWFKTRPTARGKGYATTLLKLLCKEAKKIGHKEITGQASIENTASNKVFEKNGFSLYQNPLCLDWDDTNFWRKDLI